MFAVQHRTGSHVKAFRCLSRLTGKASSRTTRSATDSSLRQACTAASLHGTDGVSSGGDATAEAAVADLV